MGCSSSSAQTVDQEKRPGTKPEESNGAPVAVRNGIIPEDTETIKDQMQLPVQSALPDDLLGADDEVLAVTMGMEAQEDLGSGEDLMAAPQQIPATLEESTPITEASEASAELAVAPAVEEAVPPLGFDAPVDTLAAEKRPEVKAPVETSEEVSAVEPVVPMPTEAPAIVEQVSSPEASPEVSTPVVEPEPAQVPVVDVEPLVEASPEVVAPKEAEAPSENAAQVTAPAEPVESSTPSEASAAVPSEVIEPDAAVAVPSQDSGTNEIPAVAGSTAPVESSPPTEAVEPVIDTKIAVATIPEMPLLPSVIPEAQPEAQPSAEEAPPENAEPAKIPEEPIPEAEVPASTPVLSDASAKVDLEAPGAIVTSVSTEDSAAPVEAPGVDPTPTDSEVASAPGAAVDPSPEMVSAAKPSQDTESEKAKKED